MCSLFFVLGSLSVFAARCWLFLVGCLPHVIRCVWFIVCFFGRQLFVVGVCWFLLFVTCCLLFISFWLMRFGCCLVVGAFFCLLSCCLLVVGCLSCVGFVACCSLCASCCSLCVVSCLLFVVWCSL